MNELIDFTNLEGVLRDYADYFRNRYEQELISHDRFASGELLESIRTRIQVGDDAYTVTVTLRDYWKYIEDDTRPHWPPPGALLRWVEIKPTIPRPYTLDGREISAKSLAYLIGRRIAGLSPDGNGGFKPGGTKGTHDMATAKEQTMAAFRQRLKEAVGHDVVNYIRKVAPGAR